MKILTVTAKERKGGANIAAFRLAEAFSRLGHDSSMLVREGNDHELVNLPSVNYKDGIPASANAASARMLSWLFLRSEVVQKFSFPNAHNSIEAIVKKFDPDIVHVHWPHANSFSFRSIMSCDRLTYWTLHDMWLATGGCHYDEFCGQYETGCISCPMAKSYVGKRVIQNKKKYKSSAIAGARTSLIVPSAWMGGVARKGFQGIPVEVNHIPNGVCLETFRPCFDRKSYSVALGLNDNVPLIGFGAVSAMQDARKGYIHLVEIIKHLSDLMSGNVALLVFGGEKKVFELSGVKCVGTGHIDNEEELNKIYNCCDAFIVPSLQDNFPNTICESLASGTPVISHDVGGISGAVVDGVTGYLVDVGNHKAFAKRVVDALNHASLRESCRSFAAKELDLALSAERHLELFKRDMFKAAG